MNTPGLIALLRAIIQLILEYADKQFGSFTVEFQRNDNQTTRVLLKHGDHHQFDVPLGQVQKYRRDHPGLT